MFPARHQDDQSLHRTEKECWGTSHAKSRSLSLGYFITEGIFSALEGCKGNSDEAEHNSNDLTNYFTTEIYLGKKWNLIQNFLTYPYRIMTVK